MNLMVDINISRFFIPSNLPSPYKNKLIRLLSITVEKEVGTYHVSVKPTRIPISLSNSRKFINR